MNWIEYLPLAEKTLSEQFNCQDTFHQRILHAVMGSLTEVEEILDNYVDYQLVVDVNKQGSVAEESADIFWYISILFRELDIRNYNYILGDEFNLKTPFNTLLEFTKLSLKFLDLLKKKIFYNKEIPEDVMIDFSIKMHALLEYYCHQYDTDIDTILEKNIAKLKERYGSKFTSERAINRNLEAEKKILEGDRKVFEEEDLVSDPTFGRDELVNTGSLYLDGNSVSNRRTGGIFPNNSDMYLD